jgi:hypothetical protein
VSPKLTRRRGRRQQRAADGGRRGPTDGRSPRLVATAARTRDDLAAVVTRVVGMRVTDDIDRDVTDTFALGLRIDIVR